MMLASVMKKQWRGLNSTPAWNNGVNSFITKQNYGAQMAVDAEWHECESGDRPQDEPEPGRPVGLPGWSLIGTIETGFNPYYGYLADAQRSQVQNNGKALPLQGANADSSRTGQRDNSQASLIGLSNKTYGTLTVGRVNTLSLDTINSYHPMGGSYAFSPLGFSGSYAGFGDTEAARVNTAVKYRLEVPYPSFYGANFRLGGLIQWGGYDQGNGTNRPLPRPSRRRLQPVPGVPVRRRALDGLRRQLGQGRGQPGHFHRNMHDPDEGSACRRNHLASGIPKFYNNTDLTATLSNNTGFLFARQVQGARPDGVLAVTDGYKQANPSDDFLNGFETIGGWNVPGTVPKNSRGFSVVAWTNFTNYNVNRIAPYFWVGAKYAITPQLDVTVADHYQQQTDYNTAACTYGNSTIVQPDGNKLVINRISSNKCAGVQDAFSALIDWRPVKRVDLYAGLMVSMSLMAGSRTGSRRPRHRPNRRPAHQVREGVRVGQAPLGRSAPSVSSRRRHSLAKKRRRAFSAALFAQSDNYCGPQTVVYSG